MRSWANRMVEMVVEVRLVRSSVGEESIESLINGRMLLVVG